MNARLRLLYGDEDTPIEAAAIRWQERCEAAGHHSQGMGQNATADIVGIPTPAVQSLPTKILYTPTPEQISAGCELTRSTWTPQVLQSRIVCPLSPRWDLPEIADRDLDAG